MNSALERSVLICDKDSVVAAVGGGAREYLGKPVSSELVEVIERRKRIVRQGEEEKIPIRKAVEREELWGHSSSQSSEGQTLGGIVLLEQAVGRRLARPRKRARRSQLCFWDGRWNSAKRREGGGLPAFFCGKAGVLAR